MTLVSVCIAASDRVELLLERCLPSVFRQTHQDLEVSIAGDFVDAAVVEKILALGDPRISFVNLPVRGPYPRPGVSRWQVAGSNAMNESMRRATGEYICHLDDDDEMAPDKIERCMDACTNSTDFIYHRFNTQLPDKRWVVIGDGQFGLGQVTTGAVFYNKRYRAVGWDVLAFRRNTPGDWDRFSRIQKELNPRLRFVDVPLIWHYKENNYPQFVPKPDETFLEE